MIRDDRLFNFHEMHVIIIEKSDIGHFLNFKSTTLSTLMVGLLAELREPHLFMEWQWRGGLPSKTRAFRCLPQKKIIDSWHSFHLTTENDLFSGLCFTQQQESFLGYFLCKWSGDAGIFWQMATLMNIESNHCVGNRTSSLCMPTPPT